MRVSPGSGTRLGHSCAQVEVAASTSREDSRKPCPVTIFAGVPSTDGSANPSRPSGVDHGDDLAGVEGAANAYTKASPLERAADVCSDSDGGLAQAVASSNRAATDAGPGCRLTLPTRSVASPTAAGVRPGRSRACSCSTDGASIVAARLLDATACAKPPSLSE